MLYKKGINSIEGMGKERKEKERKTTQAAKSSSHQLRKRGHLGRKAPSPEKKRGGVSMGTYIVS